MDSLIDLSTPAKQPSHAQDFTPQLSRALADCFKRRKQSLLPIEEVGTPKHQVQADFHWQDVLQGTPAQRFDTPLLDKENDTLPIKCLTTKKFVNSPKLGSKRAASPSTPSLLKKSIKRRALEDKPNNKLFSPTLGAWPDAEELSEHEPNPVITPNSVLQMRRNIRCKSRRNNINNLPAPVMETEQEPEPVEYTRCQQIDDIRLEAAYDKWLGQQQLKELQQVIEFMELEREYNL